MTEVERRRLFCESWQQFQRNISWLRRSYARCQPLQSLRFGHELGHFCAGKTSLQMHSLIWPRALEKKKIMCAAAKPLHTLSLFSQGTRAR